MPFRRKTSKQLEEAGQPIEKSFSSPNISEYPGGNLEPGSVTVQRKKSWLSRLLKPFRKSKSRTLTEPTEQPTSSCFPLNKSSTSTFYASPYSPLERAPSQKNNAEAKRQSSESEDSESSDEKQEVPTTLPTLMQPTLLAELKISLKEREQCNGSESPEPICDIPKPIKKKSIKTRSRPLSADSGLFSGDLRNLEQIIENHYDVPDRGLFTEQIVVSNNQIRVKPQKQWNDTENQDFIKCKDFTYIEPQPIEPLHKFPKPRPPVKRRPSTRKGSRTAEDLEIPNPRRSEAELEDIIRKINEIPPPDVEPPTQNLSEMEIPSASIQPIPKKRTILPSSPTLQSQEQSQTVQIIDDAIDINYTTQPSLTEQALLETIHLNQKIIKPELPPKTRIPASGNNTLPRSTFSSPNKSISVYDIVKAFDERIINQDDLDIKPMKRVKTLPVRFHGTKDINKESSNVFTSLLNSHQKQKTGIFKRTYSLHSKDMLQNNLVEPDVNSINKLNNKENEGQEANSPSKMIPEIRKDTYRQNKTISISRESYMAEFQNTMDNYLKEINEHEVNFNQKTPPNTPEQFEESTEQDETLIEINRREISDSELIESTALSTESKREPPNSLEIKTNHSLNNCIITNDIYESLSPLMNFDETERFLQEESSSLDHDMITPDDTIDSTKFTYGIIESSENSEYLPDISHKSETTNKSQIQETIMNLKKTTHTFHKPYVQDKPDYLVRKGAIRQKFNSSSDHHSSNYLKTHYNTSKAEKTTSEQVKISTKDYSPKIYLNSEPINQEEPETKRQRSKSLH